jgi:hypothetical protein
MLEEKKKRAKIEIKRTLAPRDDEVDNHDVDDIDLDDVDVDVDNNDVDKMMLMMINTRTTYNMTRATTIRA